MESYDCLMKFDDSLYKFIFSPIIEDKFSITIMNESHDIWSLDADMTKMIDFNKNWKKFEIFEIKEIILDCIKSHKYIVKIVGNKIMFTFKIPIGFKEFDLNLELKFIDKKDIEITKDEDKNNIIQKEKETIKINKQFQVILKEVFNENKKNYINEFTESGNLKLNFSSHVKFILNITLNLEKKEYYFPEIPIYNSCYNEDLQEETEKEKLIYFMKFPFVRHSMSTGKSLEKNLKIKFISRLYCGDNKIIVRGYSSNNRVDFNFISLIAKVY